MYEDLIAALMDDMQVDSAGARARALRDQPEPPPPPPGPPPGMGPPGGATGSWGPPQPPMATQPPPMPPAPVQQPPRPPAGPMLPQALAQQAPPQPPLPPMPPPEDPLAARQQELLSQYSQAMAPPDRGPMEEAYGRRAKEGPRMLLHALAAERVGKKGLAGHYYGQAGQADAPMRMAGGTMTPTGFIEDPGYAREFTLKKIEAQIQQNDRIINSNAIRADKLEAEKRNEKLRRDLADQASKDRQAALAQSASNAAQASADRRFLGGLAHQDRQAAAGAKVEKSTESERAAAGYLGRMEAVEPEINRLMKTGRPSLLTKTLGSMGMTRAARPIFESADQQQYRAVQEDWVRAKLRKESGASIPPDEMEREIETYFPQPGETDPAVLQAKAQARAQAAQQLRTSAGKVESTIAPPVGGASGPLSPQESEELLLLRQRFKTRN